MAHLDDRDRIKLAVVVLLATCYESDFGVPSGMAYIALQTIDAEFFTLDRYHQILQVCRDWIVDEGHVLHLTDAGRPLGKKASESFAKAGVTRD